MRLAIAFKQTLQRQDDFALASTARATHKHPQLLRPIAVGFVCAAKLSHESISNDMKSRSLFGVEFEFRKGLHVHQLSCAQLSITQFEQNRDALRHLYKKSSHTVTKNQHIAHTRLRFHCQGLLLDSRTSNRTCSPNRRSAKESRVQN